MTLIEKAYQNLTNLDFDTILSRTGEFFTWQLADYINDPSSLAKLPYNQLKILADLDKANTKTAPVRFYKPTQRFNSDTLSTTYKAAWLRDDPEIYDWLNDYAKRFDLTITRDKTSQTKLDSSTNIQYTRYYDFINDQYVYVTFNKNNKLNIEKDFVKYNPTGILALVGTTIDEVLDNLINHKLIEITKLHSKHIVNVLPDQDFMDYVWGKTIMYPAEISNYEGEAMLKQIPDNRKNENNLDRYMQEYYHAKLI